MCFFKFKKDNTLSSVPKMEKEPSNLWDRRAKRKIVALNEIKKQYNV
jgi:hypothetical protein